VRPARPGLADTHGHRAALVLASLVLAGCAAYHPPRLAVTHPAHPDAPAAREAPASRTLAYTPADVAAVRAVPAAPAGEPPAAAARGRTVVGEGEVVAAVPGSSQIVLEHGEIEGFMEAMTMGYRIEPPSLLAKVKPGDRVRFTIDVQRRAIVEIETLR
jgi:Cu/Ag efflux protein CusF